MKVYNVMSYDRSDEYCEHNFNQEGCYLRKEDAISRKEAVVEGYLETYKEHINGCDDERTTESEMYFDVHFGEDSNYHSVKVWIDELEVH